MYFLLSFSFDHFIFPKILFFSKILFACIMNYFKNLVKHKGFYPLSKFLLGKRRNPISPKDYAVQLD